MVSFFWIRSWHQRLFRFSALRGLWALPKERLEARHGPWLYFLLGKVWWNFWGLFNHGPMGPWARPPIPVGLWLDPVPLMDFQALSGIPETPDIHWGGQVDPIFHLVSVKGDSPMDSPILTMLIMVVSIRSHNKSSMTSALVSGDCGQAEVGAAAINFGFKKLIPQNPYTLVSIELVIQVKLNHMPYDEMK